MHAKVQPLVDEAAKLAELWKSLAERWSLVELPTDVPYARFHGATFNEFSLRVMATLDLVTALGQVDDAGQLLFLPKVESAKKHLSTATSSVDQLLSELNSNPKVRFQHPSGNLDELRGFVNGSHAVNIRAGGHLEQISGSMAALFDLVSSGLKFGRAKGLSLYHRYGTELQDLVFTVKRLHEEIKGLRDSSAEFQLAVKRAAESTAAHEEAARQDRGEVASVLKAVQSAQSEVDAKVAAIRETSKAAAALEAQVEGFEASFAAFQKSLDDRVAQHEAFEQSMADALTKNQGREDDIDRLIEKADSMIKGATTAGLGHSLEETRKLYEKRMLLASLGFFASIVVLAISAIPLVAHVLPGLFASWLPQATGAGPAPTNGNGEAIFGLLGKVFLLFPATWLTQFFAKAYSEFFHLEREYAHKTALARSVEGFKKQAPKYQEEITTAVFDEVKANPSKQNAPDAAEHPIIGPLSKKFIDALPIGKSDETRAKQ